MQKITVVNAGKRIRVRAGHRFKAGEETTVEVTAAGARAIRATADLQVVESSTGEGEDTPQPVPANTVDVSEMTVRQITAALQSGELSREYVYEQEQAGKQRSSVLDAVAPDEGNDEGEELVVTKDGEDEDGSGPGKSIDGDNV